MKTLKVILFLFLLKNAYPSSVSLYVTVIETRAFLSILVQDENGIPIEGAMVTIEKGLKIIGTGTTNSTGRSAIAIGVGSYDILITATGFGPSSYNDY